MPENKINKSDSYLNKVFYSSNSNRKYSFELLLDTLVFMLKMVYHAVK
jgi:hypothetical protein